MPRYASVRKSERNACADVRWRSNIAQRRIGDPAKYSEFPLP